MKYMTFRSSCAYAGVANMLAQYGVDTDDRTIAVGMKLPYMFAYEDGAYMAGPMLQKAQWFNLYLNPIGYQMDETKLEAKQVPKFLMQQKTAMIGLRMQGDSKHAVVYIGCSEGKLRFLNNKRERDPAPEQISLTEEGLLMRLDPTSVVAVLTKIAPKEVDLSSKMRESPSVIRQNLGEIQKLSGTEETVGALREKMNPLFRPLLLDGITMLGLLGERELAQKFTVIQRRFLNALGQEPEQKIRLDAYLVGLGDVTEDYIRLIERAL